MTAIRGAVRRGGRRHALCPRPWLQPPGRRHSAAPRTTVRRETAAVGDQGSSLLRTAPAYGEIQAVGAVCQASSMRGPTPSDVLAHVTLVTGKEEFLSERTVVGVREAVRRHDHEAEISETQASGLTLAQLGELAAPSLFSSTRCVVVRGLENLPEESVDGLLDYAASPADDVALVLVHGGWPEGLRCADQAAQARHGHRGEVRGAARLGVPRVRHRRGAAAGRHHRARGGRVAGAGRRPGPPLARRRPPTSWPTTSRARR